eukprot:403372652
MTQLQTFFNNFFALKEVQQSNNIILYFKEKCAEQQSKKKVEELIEYLHNRSQNGNNTRGNQQQNQQQQVQAQQQRPQQQSPQNQNQGQNNIFKEDNQMKQGQNLIAQAQNSNFDVKAFENECRKIVNDISDKFLDLGLDDGNHSDYGNMMIKQEKFGKEFERLNFQFDSQALHIPKGSQQSDEILEEEDQQLGKEHMMLGGELDRIHQLMHKSIKQQILAEGSLIQYNQA